MTTDVSSNIFVTGKVFVTGGLGFIGGNLALHLLDKGYEVTVYDVRTHGEQPWHHKLFSHPRCQCVIADLRDRETLKQSLAGHEMVFHLAANANSRLSAVHHYVDMQNGVEATWTLLHAMAEQGIKKIVYATSQLVYGEPEVPLYKETFGPLLPMSLYGASKLAGEGIISSHSNLYGIHATLVRFSNIAGPNMSYGIVRDFVRKLQENPEELEILGNGLQERNYLHVEDCISAMLTVAKRTTGKLCDVYNVGNTDYITAKEVADIIAPIVAGAGKKTTYTYTGGKHGWKGDVQSLRCDISKLCALGWKPSGDSTYAVARAAAQTLQLSRVPVGVAS